MTSLPITLSLLSALVAKGFALSCIHCMSFVSSTCSGNNVTCPSGHLCASSYIEASTDSFPEFVGISVPILVRQCLPSFTCDSAESMSSLYAQVRMVTSCCDTDNCTPDIPAIPTKLSQPNGLVCRSCQHTDPWCLTSKTISCRGNENMCLHQTIQMKGPISFSAAIWHCTSQAFCQLDPLVYKSEGMQAELNLTCRSKAYQCT
ncbi:phospholipase A2 inhibitor 25 kDa subunit-like [Phyllobates terribilis]|uniref:phospholipase A2 inhibitor 25 kDa subunit-like n=1 Tax=Phyllobates terribilis TaxID=111132 RepID=UPI003CCB72AE